MAQRVQGMLILGISLFVVWLLLRAALKTRPRHRRGMHTHFNANGRSKRAYSSARDAAAAAMDYEHDFGQRMNPYRCERGEHWHIGHAEP